MKERIIVAMAVTLATICEILDVTAKLISDQYKRRLTKGLAENPVNSGSDHCQTGE